MVKTLSLPLPLPSPPYIWAFVAIILRVLRFSHLFLLISIKIAERELTHAGIFLNGNEQKQMGE